MDNIDVLINKEGKIEYLPSYILLKPNRATEDGIELIADATIYEYGLAVLAVYDTFLKEASKYSEQDIFDVCKAIGLDYDVISDLVKEYR